MWFKCAVCTEKDNRIADLKSEIASLRKLAFPAQTAQEANLYAQEVDRLLSGSDDPIHISADTEASNILTGMYETDQIEVI